MAIVRKYGSAATAGLAQKAGENIGQQKQAELDHQTALQNIQRASERSNLELQIQGQLERAVIDERTQANDNAQKQLMQQARDRATQDWEFEKLQIRSQNDFALEEKKYGLKKEYEIQKGLQEQIETDNKILQLDKDASAGRIDNKVKRSSGLTEYEELYNTIQHSVKPIRQSSDDAFNNLIMNTLQPEVAPTVEGQPEQTDVAIQPPVAPVIPQGQKAFTGSLWWKKPNPAVIDPALKAAIRLPNLSMNDKAAILYLLQFGANSSPEILAAKGKIYKKLMSTLKG